MFKSRVNILTVCQTAQVLQILRRSTKPKGGGLQKTISNKQLNIGDYNYDAFKKKLQSELVTEYL